jgi:hypothetical protein
VRSGVSVHIARAARAESPVGKLGVPGFRGLADLEKIPLKDLHRHCLVTHLKGNADCVFQQLEKLTHGNAESFAGLLYELVKSCFPKNPEWLEDKWVRGVVPVDRCYFAHKDFRHRRVPEGERFVDFLDNKLQEIERGSFPCSYEIRARWEGEMLEPLVEEREPESEKYYVHDGQLRVIWHWYHNEPNVKVFIHKGLIAK